MENIRITFSRKKINAWIIFACISSVILACTIKNMANFAFEVSAGNKYLDLIEADVAPETAKREAVNTGYICASFYLLGFPIPVYILSLLGFALILGLNLPRPLPLVRISAVLILLSILFWALYFIPWDNKSFAHLLMGSFGIWLLISSCYAILVFLGRLCVKNWN